MEAVSMNYRRARCKPGAYLVVLYTGYPVPRDDTPLPVRPDPKFRMDLVLGDHLARQDVPHEQVVVHCICDDLGDGRRVEFNEGVVF